MTADITDFYLNTPLERKEYLRIQAKCLPAEVVKEFGFDKYMVNGSVLFEVNKRIVWPTTSRPAGTEAPDRASRERGVSSM